MAENLADATALSGEPVGLQAVEPGFVHVLRIRTLAMFIPLLIGAIVLDSSLLDGSRARGLASLATLLLATIGVVVAPQRRWRRLRYQLHPAMLQVVRGWLFHTDTIVPFVRVQHIDVNRDPLDKMFGTASLVVHTAGTHNSIVTLPGLSPERAKEIRDLIRSHIRSDLE